MNNVELSLLIWNVFVCLYYGFDKICAKNKWKRIRERSLLGLTFLMGGVGAMFGMVLFNHKTAKMKFRILTPLFVLFNIAFYILLNTYILK